MAKMKLKKTLYVGVGGTGAEAVLKAKCNFIDAYGEIPPMVGFLVIDTNTGTDNLNATARNGQIIKFEPDEIQIITVRDASSVYQMHKSEFAWLPEQNVQYLTGIRATGAGQVRSNGRFILRHNARILQGVISNAVNKINRPIPLSSRYSVDLDKGNVEYATMIYVVGSVAGGTGSGMLVDIMCLINKTMKNKGNAYEVYPWLVLPDIFRAISDGPSMANTYPNAFGAIKELDYLMHLKLSSRPIDFKYDTITEPPAVAAFMFNYVKRDGVAFPEMEQLTDVLGKSMFLPANNMGDEFTGPFDNVRANRFSDAFQIENKQAWGVSCGSAELIYDNQAVGHVLNHRLIIRICKSLMNGQSTGITEANNFVDDPNVLIRENEGKDNVIDALLEPNPQGSMYFDENTTDSDVQAFICQNTDQSILNIVLKNYNNKVANTKQQLQTYVIRLLNSKNGISDASGFLSNLLDIIALCSGEMENEKNTLTNEDFTPNWQSILSQIPNTGLSRMINGRVNQANAQLAQEEVNNYIVRQKELIRRDYAIQFYAAIVDDIKQWQQRINTLKNFLRSIVSTEAQYVNNIINNSQSKSKFAIFLHKDDVAHASLDNEFDYETAFVSDMQKKYPSLGIAQLLGQDQENVRRIIDEHTRNSQTIISAVNVSIEDKLKIMPKEKVDEYLQEVLALATPMWKWNTQGYTKQHYATDEYIIVGVPDRGNTVVSTHAAELVIGNNKPKFASTYRTDRIMIMRIEDLLPIYAVNNFLTYKGETEEKAKNPNSMCPFTDAQWHFRMEQEHFDVMPTQETDNTLKMWVMGFIFNLIQFDESTQQYYTTSTEHGDAMNMYRLDLGYPRNVAFETFKNLSIFREIDKEINAQTRMHGTPWFDQQVAAARVNGAYYNKNSQNGIAKVSVSEMNQMELPNFAPVKSLITDEINFIAKSE